MTMRIFLAALAVTLMTVSAGAQGVGGADGVGGGGLGGRHQQRGKSASAEAPKPKVDEKAYNAALKSIPDRPFDAWSGVR